MSYNLHETAYRGAPLLQRLERKAITVCGAGALGANLVEQLARMGARQLTVIDRDRVEPTNLATQPYGRADLGAQKATILTQSLYRSLGCEIRGQAAEISDSTVRKLLRGSELVIDCLDNRAGRLCVQQHCRAQNIPLLHGGVNGDYAEVVWDQEYTVPSGAGEDVCDYPLARNLVSMTVACLAETVLSWLEDDGCKSLSLTLRDYAIRPWLA